MVLVIAFVLLGWWQLERAAGGNGLSWGYAFEWPLLAVCTVALWVREVRNELGQLTTAAQEEQPLSSPFTGTNVAGERDAELGVELTGDEATDAYNHYLAWLSANPDRRPSEYPG